MNNTSLYIRFINFFWSTFPIKTIQINSKMFLIAFFCNYGIIYYTFVINYVN